MSFFIKNKRKNVIGSNKFAKVKKKVTSKLSKNEEITSSEDEDYLDKDVAEESSSDENETAQEKKVRLAKAYLEEIQKEEAKRLANDVDERAVSRRLKEDYLKETGRLRLSVADSYSSVDDTNASILKCREQTSITCLCITSDDKYIFSGSKNGVVVKYSIASLKKEGVIPFVKQPDPKNILGHSKSISSIAISSDNKFLVVGDESVDIHIWDPKTLKFIKKLCGHKGGITGLCFRKDTHTLYSCSKDRTIKVWNLDEMSYVETLFGHQDVVTSIDALYKDRLASCGGRDLRIFKITEETQLIFNGHEGNIDCVKLINEENFLSCGDDGQICIWSVMRKKPLCVIKNAHGSEPINGQPLWINTVTSFVNTDLVASGSRDGYVKLWKLENSFKTAKLCLEIPIVGFVNAMSFTSDGTKLVIGVSREHRFGRWTTEKSAKNVIMVIPFNKK